MRITTSKLNKLCACASQVEVFHKEWPNGAEANLKNVNRSIELGLDVNWLAHRVLREPARIEYNKVYEAAWIEYNKAYKATWIEYDKVYEAAWIEYNKVYEAARIECDKVRGRAFVDALKLEAK